MTSDVIPPPLLTFEATLGRAPQSRHPTELCSDWQLSPQNSCEAWAHIWAKDNRVGTYTKPLNAAFEFGKYIFLQKIFCQHPMILEYDLDLGSYAAKGFLSGAILQLLFTLNAFLLLRVHLTKFQDKLSLYLSNSFYLMEIYSPFNWCSWRSFRLGRGPLR